MKIILCTAYSCRRTNYLSNGGYHVHILHFFLLLLIGQWFDSSQSGRRIPSQTKKKLKTSTRTREEKQQKEAEEEEERARSEGAHGPTISKNHFLLQMHL
jgi:hypothetical protein